MARHNIIAFSTPLPGRDEEFINWIEKHHIPEVLAVPGFLSAQRLELTTPQYRQAATPYRYATLWEIESDDLPATFAALSAAVQKGTKTDTRDPANTALWVFTPAGPLLRQEDYAANAEQKSA